MVFLADLVKGLPQAVSTDSQAVEVARVVADSRRVLPGDLFVAVRGTALDGHDCIAEAIRNGAAAIVGDRPLDTLSSAAGIEAAALPYVLVPNSRTAHAALLRATRADIREALAAVRCIGVTGTNGKTTVATVLEQALEAMGEPTAFLGTTGYRFGGTVQQATHTTPDVDKLYDLIVQAHQSGASTIVMEVSSHALDQERVAGIDFAVAVFTNLSRDHLDYHGSMEAYADTKKLLFSGLAPSAVAVVYADDPWSPHMVEDCPSDDVRTVGRATNSSWCITNEEQGPEGSTFAVGGVRIETALLGAFNVVNVALSVVVLQSLGYDGEQISRGIAGARGAAGRMEQYRLPSGALAVVDFAHTPDALENALATLRPLVHAQRQLIVVFGCGGDRDRGKRPLMGAAAERYADSMWVTSDNPRGEAPYQIIQDILAGVSAGGQQNAIVQEDRRMAIQGACQAAKLGDVVLIAGKGHETYQQVGAERHHFSDAEEVRALL